MLCHNLPYHQTSELNIICLVREFKPREQTAEIVKIPETEEDTKKPVETRFDQDQENGSQNNDNEDKFRRTKSTKSNKSLTLPLDPVKRKDSGASSRDFSTVKNVRL